MRQLLQFCIVMRLVCKFLEARARSECDDKIAVSSAYIAIVIDCLMDELPVKRRYRFGHKTLPCGTPNCIGHNSKC